MHRNKKLVHTAAKLMACNTTPQVGLTMGSGGADKAGGPGLRPGAAYPAGYGVTLPNSLFVSLSLSISHNLSLSTSLSLSLHLSLSLSTSLSPL